MRRQTYDPARLSYLIEVKVRLAVHCNNQYCLYRSVLEVQPLIEKLGAEYPIPWVSRHMKYTRCGKRDCSVNPNWNDEPGRPIGFNYPGQMLGDWRMGSYSTATLAFLVAEH